MKNSIRSFSISLTVLLIIFTTDVFSQMYWNQAASFAGNNTSYISIPNSASTDITGSFSIEAWINPATLSASSKGILSKGGALGTNLRYAVRLTTAGRIAVSTNGTQRIISTLSNPLTINKWTHISATYNSTSSTFSIYINDALDTSAVVAGANTLSNTDSLFIGISGASTPFSGKLDEVRLWNRELSASEVGRYMRTSLGTSSGIYSGLVLSMTFQKENSEGTIFTARDFSGNLNNGNPRNVSAFDQSFRPLQTISQNDNIELDGDEDYLAAGNTAELNPAGVFITLDCWVYPRTANQTCNLITKGNQYALILENGILKAKINGSTGSSNANIPANQWTRVTMQYSGFPNFYINGKYLNVSNPLLGNLTAGTDSLYIGGVPGATADFNGYMDEVRIFDLHFSDDELYFKTFHSIDRSNAPLTDNANICYNFDGALYNNSDEDGPVLYFRNNARFAHTGGFEYKPVSPLNRDENNLMPYGFYLGETGTKIPLSGSAGKSDYILKINLDTVITDIDLMIALNHTNLSSLNITLIAPNNDSVRIATGLTTTTADNSLTTIFDDQADSASAANKYVSFHTTMRPQNSMNSVFAGDRSIGVWKIRVNDLAAGDTGHLNFFGIKINNMPVTESNFFLTNLIQGLYDPSTDETVKDTMTMYVRKSYSPFELVDSCKRVMNQAGESAMSFKNVIGDTTYYVQLKHRNSIEVWRKPLMKFKYKFSSAIFYLSPISTFGDNEIQIDASPVRFGMFSGDVDQNGFIDLADVLSISNKANEFATGYIVQDLTGNNIADLNDVLIAYNNSTNFVHRITPLD